MIWKKSDPIVGRVIVMTRRNQMSVSVLTPYRKRIDAESIIIARLIATSPINPGCARSHDIFPEPMCTPHLLVFLNPKLFQNIARKTARKIVTVSEAEARTESHASFDVMPILSR